MWKTGESVEEQIETGVIILVSAVALVQVPLNTPDHNEGMQGKVLVTVSNHCVLAS